MLQYMLVSTITLLLASVETSDSARILAVAPSIAKSHHKVYNEVFSELSRKGHELYLVSPIPPKNLNCTVYCISDMERNMTLQQNITRFKLLDVFMEKPTFLSMFKRHWLLDQGLSKMFVRVFQHYEVQRLLKTEKKFDVCIVEWFYPTLAAFGHYFECPLIGISSTGMLLPALDAVGNPAHPVLAPDHDLPLSRDMTFFERAWSGIWAIYARVLYQLITLPREEKTIKEYFGDDIPPLSEMIANMSLLLLNTNIIFHRPVPHLPTVVQFGGRKNQKPLSVKKEGLDKDLEQFISNSKNGVVYFSLGSGVQPETLDPYIIKTFQDTFASLPFNFVWKWNGPMTNMPKNVLTRPWVPQEAVLGHPNVKLFIYQGGLQSTEEAIFAHKPVIGIPFHSDQTFNIDSCVKYGMGEMMSLEQMTVERFKSLILQVYNSPSYIRNAEKLDMLIRDQPMDGLDKAVWWIEYVIRHKGARHLRSPAATMPLWQYLMLDVIAFLFVILYVSYRLIRFICLITFRFLRNGAKFKTD